MFVVICKALKMFKMLLLWVIRLLLVVVVIVTASPRHWSVSWLVLTKVFNSVDEGNTYGSGAKQRTRHCLACHQFIQRWQEVCSDLFWFLVGLRLNLSFILSCS